MTPWAIGWRSMEIEMKGLHSVRKRLASGKEAVYHYAWRGGPRIEAPHGTPAFVAEFQRLTEGRDKPAATGTLQDLITAYQKAPAFADLAAETRAGYVRRIRKIEAKFGTLPIRALADSRVRGVMLDWRDKLAEKGRREADYTFAVLARILSWAQDRGRIARNPIEKPGRLYSGSRAESIWTDAEIAAVLAQCPPHVALPIIIATDTGQRLGDILALPWSAYDGATIRLRQGKTGKHVSIPATDRLRLALDTTPRRAVTICATTRGTSWTRDGYQTAFDRAKRAAKVAGRTFHDFRGTAVTRLAEAGCTIPEIAAITGHDLRFAEDILARHYLARSSALGESAIAKLERHRAGTASGKLPVKRSADGAGE
jgi:integrase